MAQPVCCVDHHRPGTKSISGRWFCDDHYRRATYQRAGFWRTEIIAIIGLLVFVGLVVALDTYLQPQLTGIGLVLAGVLLAMVPAVLWLYFFYQQDRLEPEPVGNVARMFFLALALAGAFGIPLTDQLFAVQDWIYRSDLITWLASIFIYGAAGAFFIYATVRIFMFDLPEFDERTDGVIYGTAAGLGYATALNLQFILSNGGAALGTGEIFVAEVALAYAAFGGLLGYFLGRAKLEHEPVWWLPAGTVLAAVLIGAFMVLRGELDPGVVEFSGQGGGLPSVRGLLLAGGLAVLLTALVSYLINRDVKRTLSEKQPAVVDDPTIGDRQASVAVFGAFFAMLLVGGLARHSALNSRTTFNVAGIQGAYPAHYSVATGEGDLLRVSDSLGTGAEMAVFEFPLASGDDADGVAALLAAERGTDFRMFKVMSSGNTIVNGRPALTQSFAYVEPNGLTGAAPEVRQGLDYIFVDDGRAVIVTLLTTPEDQASVESYFARLLNSLEF